MHVGRGAEDVEWGIEGSSRCSKIVDTLEVVVRVRAGPVSFHLRMNALAKAQSSVLILYLHNL